MELDPVSHLLAYMTIVEADHGSTKLIPQWMKNAGHSQQEITEASNEARTAGYISDEGLGNDALTETGRMRGVEALRILEPNREISFDEPSGSNEPEPTSPGNLPPTRM